jgi:sec-independent protein translocase protein TatA
VQWLLDHFIEIMILLKRRDIMFGLGMPELIVIMVIVLIIFGAGKLPEIGGAIGKGIKGFKKSMKEPDEIDITPKDDKDKGTPQKQ